MNTEYICKYCGKKFDSPQSLGGHMVLCPKNPKSKDIINKIISTKKLLLHTYTLTCPVCGNSYELTMTEHAYRTGRYRKTCSSKCAHILTANKCPKDKNIKISNTLKKNGYSKCTMDRYHPDGIDVLPNGVELGYKWKSCEYCGKLYKCFCKESVKKYELDKEEFRTNQYCCTECTMLGRHKKLSNSAKSRHFGGLTNPSKSKYHKGIYHDILYDSSWELAYIVYHIDHGLNIQRYKGYRTYVYNGIKHKYYPDFITDNGIVEIKGYYSDKVKAKSIYNPDIIILFKKDMELYIKYAKNKYGKKYWEVLNQKQNNSTSYN